MTRPDDPLNDIDPREIDARVLWSYEHRSDRLIAFKLPEDWGGAVRLAYYSRGFRRSLAVDPEASPIFSWRDYQSAEGAWVMSVSVQLGRENLGVFELDPHGALYGDTEGMKEETEGMIKHVIRTAQEALEG